MHKSRHVYTQTEHVWVLRGLALRSIRETERVENKIDAFRSLLLPAFEAGDEEGLRCIRWAIVALNTEKAKVAERYLRLTKCLAFRTLVR